MDAFPIAQADVERFADSLQLPGEESIRVASVETSIRVAFAASLQTNEHRPCSFRIGWGPPANAAVLLRFEEQLPFDVAQVRRLAAASGQSALIGVDDDKIWGLGARLSNCRFFVDAVGPGSLKLGGWALSFSLIIEPDGTTFVGDTGGHPMSTIANLIKADHPDTRRRILVANALSTVLGEMRRLGHGGTLIVLGRGPADFGKHCSSWQSTIKPAMQVPSLIDAILNPPEWITKSANRAQHTSAAAVNLESLLKTYAELSLMDGAVILDADLSLLGIGAKLSATGDPDVQCFWPSAPPRTEVVPLARLGGTRHQSAARFIAAHRDALALVVSADGPTTAFCGLNEGHGVAAIKRLDWLF